MIRSMPDYKDVEKDYNCLFEDLLSANDRIIAYNNSELYDKWFYVFTTYDRIKYLKIIFIENKIPSDCPELYDALKSLIIY